MSPGTKLIRLYNDPISNMLKVKMSPGTKLIRLYNDPISNMLKVKMSLSTKLIRVSRFVLGERFVQGGAF